MVLILIVIGGYIVAVSLLLPVRDEPAKADAIVAISGGDTNARVQKAIRLYKQGYAPKLVFSGAAEDPNSPSNAKIMRRTALRNNVPEEAIIIDEAAVDTKQNASGVKEKLGDVDTVILVTSEYHQRRASKVFKKAFTGVKIINVPAEDKHWGQRNWFLKPYGWWISISEPIKLLLS